MSQQIKNTSDSQTNASESEQVLLAVRVEEARSSLLNTMLENSALARFIANELVNTLRRGADCSDIILIKNCDNYKALLQMFMASFPKTIAAKTVALSPLSLSYDEVEDDFDTDYLVQDEMFVQHSSQEYGELYNIPASVYELMREFHFLPVFLIDTAAAAEKQLPMSGGFDEDYQRKLRKNRLALSNLRQQMISSNTGLVAFVGHKYKTHTLSFEDLMQEGLVGLIKAVDRFDPGRGICFSTYAIYWIRQAISRLIVKQDKVVPLPVALAEKASSVFEAMRNCYLKNERWPSLAELKNHCDLSEQELKLISSYYQATHNLENASGDEDAMDVMDKMQQSQFAHPLDQLVSRDLVQYVDKAVASLPEKQATILAMRFGLKNHTEMTLQAVADQLQVTRERVRQIQNEALNKLKQQFGFDLMLFLEPNDS